jgi:exosortase A
MNGESEQAMTIDARVAPPATAEAGWRVALPLLCATIAAILVVYWRTAESIVAIWSRSETFQHGFIIVPISLALIWSKRHEVARIAPAPDWLGAALLAGAGLAWLVATAGEVQVIQQYAMVAMIPAAVVAVAGRRVALALTFPLGFLLLGVPVGEALMEPLMDWTANVAVIGLKLSGIPVYREATFFTIPSGHWSVVEACSGLRYLIASVTVGALFAYLNYRRPWKRVLFVVLSVVVPIVANGLRAYMIVMIAHLSNMTLALGVDHLIYGWVFFGAVMLLLFWVGSYWRDPEPAAGIGKSAVPLPAARASFPHMALAALVAIAVSAVWPVYAGYLDREDVAPSPVVLAPPAPASGWTIEPAMATNWYPRYKAPTASVLRSYRKGDRVVVVYLGYYRHQTPNVKLVTSVNVMIHQEDPVWSPVGESRRREDLGNGPHDVRQTLLRSNPQRLLIWDWFRVAGQDLSNPLVAKLLLARDKLLGRGDDGAAIIVAVPYVEQVQPAEETMRLFLRDMLPSIESSLAGTRGVAAAAKR